MSLPVKAYLWDASALVRMHLKDGKGTDEARHIFNRHPKGFHFVTEYSKTEVLGALKRKWLKGMIDVEAYLEFVKKIHDQTNIMKLCDIKLDEYPYMQEAQKIVREFRIDVIDAAAIVGVSNGILGFFREDSGPFLVTADNDMAKAAKSRHIKVINLNDCSE